MNLGVDIYQVLEDKLMSPSFEDKQRVAFARYEGRGAVDGHDAEDWYWAEMRLRQDGDVQSAVSAARLDAFFKEFFESQRLLEDKYGTTADLHEIQEALKEQLGIKDDLQLPLQNLSADSIVELIKDIEFEALRPVRVESITFDHSILPEGLPTRFDEEVVKFKGEQWEIHQYDADNFPHPVHAHLRGTGLKMDLRNGCIYRKREVVSQMKKKDLKQLRDRIQHIEGVPTMENEQSK